MIRDVSNKRFGAVPAKLPGRLLIGLGVAIMLAIGSSACTKEGAAARSSNATGGDIPEVLATVGGDSITLTDLRGRVGPQLDMVEAQYLRQRSNIIEGTLAQMVRERILVAEAQKQGKSADDLIVAEAGPGGIEPNEIEVAAWYQDNQSRVGGRTLAEVRPQIIDLLRTQRREEAERKLNDRLDREYRVAMNFEPYRITLDNSGAPSLGKEGAPVSVVEFSDFECPFCARFAPTLKQLASNFGADVHVVYRQFPIPSLHANAIKAAEASLCAHEQGKFWELHDLMFAEQQQLRVQDLKVKAGRIGLDQRRFDSCLDSGKYVEQIQKDMQEGERLGIRGTPAVFVNGVAVPGGAVPYETVAAAVQRELDRVKR